MPVPGLGALRRARWFSVLVPFTCSFAIAQQFEPDYVALRNNQAPADVDGDGLADLLELDTDGVLRMQRNLGRQRFAAPATLFRVAAEPGLLEAGDLDGDGDLDFVSFGGGRIGNTALRIDFHLQQAGGAFTTLALTTVPVTGSNYPTAMRRVDLDQDGDLDLVLGSTVPFGNNLYALRNDGNLAYTDVTAAWFGGRQFLLTSAILDTDVDGDGRRDLLLLGSGRLLRNTGTTFLDESPLRLPPEVVAAAIAGSVGDFDRDGDGDVLLGGGIVGLALLENRAGVFVDVTATSLPLSTQQSLPLAVADLDADGDLDAVVAGAPGGLAQVLSNDGSGRLLQVFQVPRPAQLGGVQLRRASVVDLELDGDPDLVGSSSPLLLTNDGRGALAALVPDTRGGIAADMDNDGNLDLVTAAGVALQFPGGAQVLRPLQLGAVVSKDQLGDIDGDGDLDVVRSSIHRNDGTGQLALDPNAGISGMVSLADAFADFDGDGDLDLVRTPVSQPVQFYTNNGVGVFSPVALGQPSSIALAVVVGDADADGLVDVLVVSANALQPSVLLRNVGGFAFVQVPVPPAYGSSAGHSWFDPNGSGQPVLLHGSLRLAHRLVGGAFVDVTASLPAGVVGRTLVGDVDQDGDLDLVGQTLLRNQGGGTYTQETAGSVDRLSQLADLDGDGDLDLVTTSKVRWNRERQLAVVGPAKTGRTARLEIVARPGRAFGELALLCLSLQQAVPPFRGPLGPQHLARLDAVLPVVLPNVSGLAEVDLPVPAVPAIVGVEVLFQALHVGAGGLRFGNLARTRLE